MYAWIWRRLPGEWPAKTAIAIGLVIVVMVILWYFVFPWVEEAIQFDHGTVDGQ
jgi:hypothetical protein